MCDLRPTVCLPGGGATMKLDERALALLARTHARRAVEPRATARLVADRERPAAEAAVTGMLRRIHRPVYRSESLSAGAYRV
jgi:hypothetical protein